MPSGRDMDLVRAVRKVEGNVVCLIGRLKDPSGTYTRQEVKGLVKQELEI